MPQGLTEEQAVEKCPSGVRVYTKSFTPLRGSVEGSPLKTFIKVLVEEGSEKVVGCHMVGEDAPEIIQVRVGDGGREGREQGQEGLC
jgi:glutathione reductase (NADPH)